MGVILGGDIFFIFVYFISLTLGRSSLLVFALSSIFIIVTVFFGERQGLCALTFFFINFFHFGHSCYSKAYDPNYNIPTALNPPGPCQKPHHNFLSSYPYPL